MLHAGARIRVPTTDRRGRRSVDLDTLCCTQVRTSGPSAAPSVGASTSSIPMLPRCDHLRMEFTSRLATLEDVPQLTGVMDAAIAELQRAFLDAEQIEASRAVMGIDTQLIEDATYFVVETRDGDVAGCGGWNR